jgi:methionine-S-sulfoxide reductase
MPQTYHNTTAKTPSIAEKKKILILCIQPNNKGVSMNIIITFMLITAALLFNVKTAGAVENTTDHTAIFAGGCFWCMESDFEKKNGVMEVVSGYIGGKKNNPTYKEVSAGKTGHYEAVRITFDPHKISYTELLDLFWKNIDPTDDSGQFCDKGDQYRSAIFYLDESQKQEAEHSKKELNNSGRLPSRVVTPILAATTFYPAEEYHQDYYRKNPVRYNFYRLSCGRDKRLKALHGIK